MSIFCKYVKQERKAPFTAARLPMPDGSYRVYREYNKRPKQRLRLILTRWQADCFALKAAMFLNTYQG